MEREKNENWGGRNMREEKEKQKVLRIN